MRILLSLNRLRRGASWLAFLPLVGLGFIPSAQAAIQCDRTITAKVVVLDNPTVFNRLGAQNPNWITYALRRDVVPIDPNQPIDALIDEVITEIEIDPITGLPVEITTIVQKRNAQLRPDKRPRPLVVRSAAGDCLTVEFQNLLSPVANPNNAQQDNLFNDDQVADRCASFHAQGVELVGSMDSDGSWVGTNGAGDLTACGADAKKSGLVGPGNSIVYTLYTPHEGTFTVNSYGATIGSEQSSGNLGIGMFAQLNVQPKGAKLYRSQLTEEEMRLATVGTVPSDCTPGSTEVVGVDCNPGGQPIIDYEALYPNLPPWNAEGKAGLPIINMLTAANELVHSDINAIIAGPDVDGSWNSVCPGVDCPYPLESVGNNNPALPNRLEAFREFSSIFHDEQTNSQVFPLWYSNPVLLYTLAGVKDQFMINYGSGGIGSEIIANRLHTGPMHDCTDCAYEEFFLASQTVGDPGMLVNFPANTGIEQCDPTNIAGPSCWRTFADANGNPVLANGPIPGNFALYQEDPSNIHHAYTGDFAKIRNIHAGAFEQHIFHLHNTQWLFNPNDDNSNYLDAQEIMPGSGHTYELVNGGVGNRNKTVGDAIFHCHFYPHFAQGMWYHIRNHDVMETGTVLAVSGGTADNPGIHTDAFALRSGEPAEGARALPDGELLAGTPIPAIVPLPGKAMPQMPAKVSVKAVDRGDFGLLAGRTPPNGLGQGADSSQAVVDRVSVAGADGILNTADDLSPGFPFWVAGNECGPGATLVNDVCTQGTVGQRAPTPVLDMLTEAGAIDNGFVAAQAGGWDGGLPRHGLLGYTAGGMSLDTQNRLDFSKVIEMSQPVYFPETGTDMEKVSMAYHAVRNRPSSANNLVGTGTPAADFVMNGAPAVPGGPFNEPCVDDNGSVLNAGVLGEWFDGDNNPSTLGTRGRSQFSADNPRTYKIANIQIDAVFNKVGYHYPQERIIALWGDVQNTIDKLRPPEPLVMRFNTFDCGKLLHTNLVPAEYELDDFQVRTPTDIIGQHIHLPKWDLTTNDGAANGWNYEDGTLAPGIVQERIHAINEFNHLVQLCIDNPATDCLLPPGTLPGQLGPIDLTDLTPVPTIDTGDVGSDVLAGATELHALPHPFFGKGMVGTDCDQPSATEPLGEYCGARTTIQRVLVDPVVNVAGVDRGLGLTFSHDHYGPSTFQQIGLYSTILAEPAGSTWVHNETGVALNTDTDGGPTSWQAAILTPGTPPLGSNVGAENIPNHREFYFEMSDFQHAYEAGFYVGADATGRPVRRPLVQTNPFDVTDVTASPFLVDSWKRAVNPPLKLKSVPFPDVVTAEPVCPGGVTRPCAEAINISHSSMWVVNYRNEPVGLRVFDPDAVGPDGNLGSQAAGFAGDLAFALQSRIDRAIPELNTSLGNTPYPIVGTGDGINRDRRPGDPFTPIMRAYEGDQVKVKIQVGATEEQHQASIHGMKWLSNGSGFGEAGNSGWRNFQSAGISEQFTLSTPVNADPGQFGDDVDYLFAQDATRDGMWSGTWGILRVYGKDQADLQPLEGEVHVPTTVLNAGDFTGVCPKTAPVTAYDVTAVLANDVLRNNLVVAIPQLGDIDPQFPTTTFGQQTVGAPLDPNGGTLVYNRRGTVVPNVEIAEPGLPPEVFRGGAGPLNDPTAMLYVLTDDLVPKDVLTGREPLFCSVRGGGVRNPRCPVRLSDTAPVEPIVLRANAGDCIEVTLRNRLPLRAPDLAGWQDVFWVVNRDLGQGVGQDGEMHFFNNNLIRPSGYVGLHPQLVEYDASRHDGVLVGQNSTEALVPPSGSRTVRWYAGDLRTEEIVGLPNIVNIVATPVEFGASNLLSADRVKQPQKGLFGSLVIEPEATTNVVVDTQVADGQANEALTPQATRLTRAQATVISPAGDAGSGGTYREGLAMSHKITNLRWKDGTAIANIHQGELGREGAEDSGHAGFNYGMEPSWFRFKLPPDVPFGNAGTPDSFGSIPNAHAMYANLLVAGEDNAVPAIPGVSAAGDPATPVFRTTAAGATNPVLDTRMYVLNGASADRDGTFMLHGHVWQRDPFVCTGTSQDLDVPLAGRCDPNAPVPSMAIGLNAQAKYMGAEEGLGHVYGHWPILFDAGGGDAVLGDYLYRDYTPSGNRNGQFGILRVQ